MAKILTQSAGSATYWHDEQDGKVALQTVTDVAPVLDRASALRNEGLTKTGMGDRHMASIPLAVLTPWAAARGLKYHEVIADDALFTQFMREHSRFIVDEASFAIKAKP